MAESPILNVRLSGPMREAVDNFCAENGVTAADLARRAICKEIGRSDLLETMRGEGRPKVVKQQPAKKRSRK